VRVFSINAPFYYDQRRLKTRPLLYGLILFARMLGPHSRLVPARLRSPQALHLKAWAVRVGGDRLNVLLINKGHRSATVNLHLPASGPAAVQRLLAPTAAADSGVRLGGQRLDDQAAWMGTPRTQTVTPSAGAYSIRVRRQSAAMLTVSVAPNTLGG
jgi:hypothetical protein